MCVAGVRERETKCGGGGAGGVSRLRPRCSCWGLPRCTRSWKYLIWISQVSCVHSYYYYLYLIRGRRGVMGGVTRRAEFLRKLLMKNNGERDPQDNATPPDV